RGRADLASNRRAALLGRGPRTRRFGHRARPPARPGRDHRQGRGRRARRRHRASCLAARTMSISAPFIRRPVATSLLAAAVLLAGILAYTRLPVAPLPRVDFPTIQVSASLPGASPETMASSVATPLERRFGRIAGLTEMTSSSTLGATSITLQF